MSTDDILESEESDSLTFDVDLGRPGSLADFASSAAFFNTLKYSPDKRLENLQNESSDSLDSLGISPSTIRIMEEDLDQGIVRIDKISEVMSRSKLGTSIGNHNEHEVRLHFFAIMSFSLINVLGTTWMVH